MTAQTETECEPTPQKNRVRAAPYARWLAHQAKVSLIDVHGTGPGERITKADVESYIAQFDNQRKHDKNEGKTSLAVKPWRWYFRWLAWAIIFVCVQDTARHLFWPGYHAAGIRQLTFNATCFVAFAVILWGARWRDV
jgi:hypothetical protein